MVPLLYTTSTIQPSTGIQKREWNVRDVFYCRSRIIEVMRRAMRREGFIEVETPTLAFMLTSELSSRKIECGFQTNPIDTRDISNITVLSNSNEY